jgi:putative ABC transport system ATP-binding protein
MAAVAPLFEGQPPIVELSHVSKDYDTGGATVRAMRDVDLSIAHGEFVAIVGSSGSGKSTMMNIIGCLDRPTRGTYTLAGIDVGSRAGDSRAIVRNRVIGFIFQGFNLLSRTTALENVELPLQYRGVSARERRRRARAALTAVGLEDRLDHTPNQLSGGQQQRVAIARALVTDPPLLLADEPTGNLDTRTSLEVLALLQKLNRDRGITIVLVTHERDIAACASRVVTMRDGRVVTDVVQDEPLDAAAELASLPRADDAPAPGAHMSDARELAAARVGGPVPFAVFVTMAFGALVGLLVGGSYVGLVLGLPVLKHAWVSVAAAEIVQAWFGARWGRRRLAAAPTSDQRFRIAFWYSIAELALAAAVFLVLVLTMGAQHWLDGPFALLASATAPGSPVLVAMVFVSVCFTILLRYLLVTAMSPRRPA